MWQAHHATDPAVARSAAAAFLLRDPVAHNVILTLLDERINHPEAGNYWWVTKGTEVIGFAMQSPLTYSAVQTTSPPGACDTLIETIFETAPLIPGIVAEATTAARFAGRWTELAKTGAVPVEGQRIYVLGPLRPPAGVPGALRRATADDLDLLIAWNLGFARDTGMPAPTDARAWTLQRLDERQIWLWERSCPVSMALVNPPVAKVCRVSYVYTPPEHRGHGYAAAVTAAVSARALDDGAEACMLYTQLANPVSNAVYRRIGYQPTAEILFYSFQYTTTTPGKSSPELAEPR